MNKYLEMVKEFHKKFNHPVKDIKDEIPLSLRQLRIKLIFEELQELSEATGCLGTFSKLCSENLTKSFDSDKRDMVEELDALCDIQYVLSGAILSMGHHENFDEAFDEVQRSNMSKLCNTHQEALDTVQWYLERDGTKSSIYEKGGDKWIVLRDGDMKILKNKYYSPANLKKFV